MVAASRNHEPCVQTMIEAQANVNAHSSIRKDTSLMVACQNGHLRVATALLDAGAVVDATDIVGRTALMLACDSGHAECARLLIRRGAVVGKTENNGWTALMFANRNNHTQCTHVLQDATQTR